MSESQSAKLTGSSADSSLRESQLRLMHAADQLILDESNTLLATLEFIVTQTKLALNARHVDILFEYADGLRIEISSSHEEIGRFVPIGRSIPGLVISAGSPVLVNDIQSHPVLRDKYFPRTEMELSGHVPRLSVVAAELTLDGQTIGAINVEAVPDSKFDESHLDFVNAIAGHISVAISHAALFNEDVFRIATDRLLIQETTHDSDVVMRQVLNHILLALDSLAFVRIDGADILLTDPQGGQSLIVAYSTNSADIGVRVDIDSSICGEAFRLARTVLRSQAMMDPSYRPMNIGMRCEMAIPITLGGSSRFPVGVLNLESTRENAFSKVGLVLAERFTLRVANAIAMTKIRADIDHERQDQLMVLAADQVLNAVHRVNNHVGSIRAMVRDMLEDLDSPGPLEQDDLAMRLRMIEYNADRALEIPDELRKRIGTPVESVDVNAQVEVGLVAVRIPDHIELVTDLAPGLPNIPCTALDLVIENLLLNSVKAMQDRPGQLIVRSWLDERLPREPFVVITVQDRGVGMTEDELGRLFEPRKAGTRGSGLGFGMIWVRSWVRRAQGLIEIESAPGVGTTVNIRFQIDPLMIDRTHESGESQ
jgi:GAF domain-containing protein